MVLVLFGRAAWNGFTSWDDNHYVTQNPTVTAPTWEAIGSLFTSFQFCNYHPLTLLSFVAEHAVVGLKPWLYHLDNVLLHAAVSILVFLLARSWLERDAPAFLAALIFTVHPLRVETVGWIAERKGLLCAAFFLGSLFAYTTSLKAGSGRARRAGYAASLALFVGALLSKVLAITLPGALIALHLCRRDLDRRRALALAPFGVLSILLAWIGVEAQAADNAIKGLHGGSLAAHGLSIFKTIGFYAWKSLVPVQLSPRYMLEPAAGLLDPFVMLGITVSLGLAAAAVWGWKRNRTVFFGIAFAGATWLPVSGIVASSTLVADRYTYLPAVGLSLVLGELALRQRLRRVMVPVLGAFVLWCCALTPARVSVWSDSLTLWTDALRENSTNPFAFNQLSAAQLNEGRYGEAAAAAMDAARHGFARPCYLFNLCMAYRGLGDLARELDTARTILEGDHDFLPAWLVVLRRLTEEKRFEECGAEISRLLAAHPDDAGLVAARGAIEEAKGNLEGALLEYLRSITLRPGDPEVLLSAAVMLARLGDLGRALRTAESTSRLSGSLSPGAHERFRELALRVEERAGPEAGALVRDFERAALSP